MAPLEKMRIKSIVLIWALFLAGLVFTIVLSLQVKSDIEVHARNDFEFACKEIQLRIDARIRAHAQILRSAAAAFSASDRITREGWHAFYSDQKVEQTLPGIQGLGFSLLIPREQLTEHIQEIRHQGFQDYTVKPVGDRQIYTSIIYLEPFSGRNLRAFGYDMFSERVRRDAMTLARDTNSAVLSGKVTLVQETDQDIQSGTLMYVPVFRKGMAHDTVTERQAALIGWVYSPYRMNDLMAGIAKESDFNMKNRIHLQIFDDQQLSAGSLLYDSQPKVTEENPISTQFTLKTHLTSNIHPWYLHFSQPAEPLPYGMFYGVLASGTTISVLLAGLFFSFANTRFKAQQLAEQLMTDLKDSEEKYRVVFNNEIYAICIFDLESLKLLDVNDAYCRLYGYSREEILSGMTIHDITAEHQESESATRQASKGATIFIPLRYHRKKDGSVFPVEIVGGPYIWKGRKVMFGLAHDITERKQAEDKLANIIREQEVILSTANVGISLIKDRVQIWINQQTADMFQYSKQELEGNTTRMLYTSQEAYDQLGKEAYPELALGHIFETTQRLVRSDGTLIWVRYNGKAIDPADIAKGVIWVLEDVTEQIEIEEQLRLSEKRFRKLFEHNTATMLMVDPENGNIIEANQAAVNFYGWPIEKLKTMRIQEINTLPPDVVKERMNKTKSTGSLRLEFRHRKADDSIHDVEVFSSRIDVAGKILLYSIIHDISERKHFEEDLIHQRWRLESIITGTRVGTWEWNVQTGETIFNERWADIIGYTLDELAPISIKTWERFVYPDDLKKSTDIMAKHFAGDLPYYECECRMKHKNGGWIWVADRGRVLTFTSEGKPLMMFGTHTDVSERKQLEEQKTRLDALGWQLQKNESLTRMAGAIAHHFNNQLGVVLGNLEIAIEDLATGKQPGGFLNKAMHGARKAAEVSSQMLTYLGQTTGIHKPMDLSEACLQYLPLLKAAIPEGIELQADLPSPGPTVATEANQLLQILTNLVTNSWESANGRQCHIALELKTTSSIDIPALHRWPIGWQPQGNNYACLEIRDTGRGIDEEDFDKLFDPFFSTKFPGRGLGLAAVLGLVKAHNGSITVESAKDQGSIFKVFLPISDETILRPTGKIAEPSTQTKQTVLLVEDDEAMREMARTMLLRLGYEVHAAKDGIEALETFRKHQKEIQAVVTDLSMPRMDGWETLSALRRIDPNIPVILASGHHESLGLDRYQYEFPHIFLPKPYKKVAMKEALERAISRIPG